ncbi:PDDEXK family nuclease [Streptomyces narbonensis]|uniref:hypothetical protein n=1 Tax=Streptomyces narbonensis TaxID=67333 RepID=UPI00167B7D9A|nr:hypothetical protein [Streptomyces narbonensis]GGW06602.1 hypothetical protein GCM10010230_48960 [Streptomyces narbonensis]
MYELAILARGGVLLTVWALAAGWPRGRLAGRLRRDGWQGICRGAWAVPGKDVDWRVRATALQLLRPELVCSHGTAARLHRIELLGGAAVDLVPPLDFTAPASSRSTQDSLIRVRATSFLTDGDESVRRGLRVTTPARTVGDLIRSCGSREEAVVAADSALARRVVGGVRREALVRYEDLAAELARPRTGGPRARAWLPLTEAASGSPAESVARLRMRDADLRPESQPPLWPAGAGRPLRPDFLFREAGLAVEVEGYAFHGTRRAHERDVARFNALQSCPEVRRVLRFTAREVFTAPDRMTATIRTALASLSP